MVTLGLHRKIFESDTVNSFLYLFIYNENNDLKLQIIYGNEEFMAFRYSNSV